MRRILLDGTDGVHGDASATSAHPGADAVGTRLSSADRLLVLEQAEALCRDPDAMLIETPDVVHLRGRLAHRYEGADRALPYLRRAVALDASRLAYRADLADALIEKGECPEAETVCRPAISSPADADACCTFARTLLGQRRVDDAQAWLDAALTAHPAHAGVTALVGDVAMAQGRLADALAAYGRARDLDPRRAGVYLRIGRAHLRGGHWQPAIDAFERGLAVRPTLRGLHVGLGRAYRGLGRLEEAAVAFRAALTLQPRDIDAARQLVCALQPSGTGARLAAAWFTLGAALEAHGRAAEALVAYGQALEQAGRHLGALFATGNVHLQLGRPRAASVWFKAVLAVEPRHQGARFNLAWSRQIRGDLARGWRAFRWHDHHGPYARRHFAQPEWTGEPLDGRTLLVWSDQGLGDAIQYLRYIAPATARAARLVVQCEPALAPIASGLPGVDRVCLRRGPMPAFDVHAPLSRLPAIFRTSLRTIPNRAPYLSADPSRVEAWHARLGMDARRPVGLVWTGDETSKSARHRFTSLRTFAPLAGVPDVRFISLQHGRAAIDLLAPPEGLEIEMFPEESRSIAETAALIMNLALVITVDTMVAHLAGALGRPVWTLVPYAPDWRWGRRRTDSDWYPTMRLFRQQTRGTWRGTIEEVRQMLSRSG